jgi:hypothetical protein
MSSARSYDVVNGAAMLRQIIIERFAQIRHSHLPRRARGATRSRTTIALRESNASAAARGETPPLEGPGQDHRRHSLIGNCGEPCQELPAIHDRHQHLQQDHVGIAAVRKQTKRFLAAARFADDLVTVRGDENSQGSPQRFIIIEQQHGPHAAR